MRFDLAQQVAVQVERLLRPQRAQRFAEAAVVVALLQAVVQPGDVEPGLQRAVFRIFVQRFFVQRQRIGPATGDLQRAAFSSTLLMAAGNASAAIETRSTAAGTFGGTNV